MKTSMISSNLQNSFHKLQKTFYKKFHNSKINFQDTF